MRPPLVRLADPDEAQGRHAADDGRSTSSDAGMRRSDRAIRATAGKASPRRKSSATLRARFQRDGAGTRLRSCHPLHHADRRTARGVLPGRKRGRRRRRRSPTRTTARCHRSGHAGRASQPMPPPRVTPWTPVCETLPAVVASPCSWVARSSAPSWAHALRCSGSTRAPLMAVRSIISPAWGTESPTTLCSQADGGEDVRGLSAAGDQRVIRAADRLTGRHDRISSPPPAAGTAHVGASGSRRPRASPRAAEGSSATRGWVSSAWRSAPRSTRTAVRRW